MGFIRFASLLLAFTFFSVAATAEDDCEALVDMADSGDIEDFHSCSESGGLNGLLQRALKKSPPKENLQSTYQNTQIKAEVASQAKAATAETAVQLPLDLAQQKQSLIFRIARECPQGFVVEGEEYRPASDGVLSLNLKYHCL